MKGLPRILIAIVILIALAYLWYFASPERSTKYHSLDKSCELDSDCVIESANLCGYDCIPDEIDVYNKETASKIQAWRRTHYKTGQCGVQERCRYEIGSPINYVPKCVSGSCVIEKSINCDAILYNRNKIYEINDTDTIDYIEFELGISISEVKRTCNYP